MLQWMQIVHLHIPHGDHKSHMALEIPKCRPLVPPPLRESLPLPISNSGLLVQGMQVVRLNMSHGDHKSHKAVVDLVREYNKLNRKCLAVMLDTKGPEVRSGDLAEPIDMKTGCSPLHPFILFQNLLDSLIFWLLCVFPVFSE